MGNLCIDLDYYFLFHNTPRNAKRNHQIINGEKQNKTKHHHHQEQNTLMSKEVISRWHFN